jgi:microcin C transport system permease protein
MLHYILKRLLLIIPTLFGVMLIAFIVTQFVPGGPVAQLLSELRQGQIAEGGEATAGVEGLYRGTAGLDETLVQELEALYGFDKPAHERFFLMLSNYLVFELGDSFFHNQSVTGLIIDRLPVSLSLGLWTFLLTYLIAVPLGVAKAVKDGTPFDVISSTIVLMGYAIPGFVLGIILLVLLGGGSFWDVFPLRGLVSDHWAELSWAQKITDYLWHMTLPVISMLVGNLAVMTLLTKNSFLEEIQKTYVLTAYAKGCSQHTVLYGHIFRNAIIPLVASFPAAFVTAFFTGSLLIETLFSLDGIGLLSYESIIKRDYPVVLGTLYIFTLLSLLAKLLTDIAYVFIDPRIQFKALNA